MRIGVFSDIHDNIWNLEKALALLNGNGAQALLFLGDFCAPFTLKQMGDGFDAGPIHAVFGNNDGDPFLLARIAEGFPHATLHGQYAELEFSGCKIAINHYPEIAKRVVESGAFDAVFSGHDHRQYVHHTESGLWANPGEIMGRFGEPTFGMFETETAAFEHVRLA